MGTSFVDNFFENYSMVYIILQSCFGPKHEEEADAGVPSTTRMTLLYVELVY